MKKSKIFILALILTTTAFTYAFADTFGISASVLEGNFTITPDFPKSVKVTVNTDINTQYKVIQLYPMRLSREGEAGITIGNEFVVWALSGTSDQNVRIPKNYPGVPVTEGINLYISGSAGAADNFTLVYAIRNVENLKPGHYTGQIAFRLQDINSVRPAVKAEYLYVYIDIPEGQGYKINITPASGSRILQLDARREDRLSDDALVEITGSLGKKGQIKQMLVEEPVSNEGNRLDLNTLYIETREISKGRGISKQPLESRLQFIYESEANGDADNNFIITYSLGDLSKEKAGKYKASIQYYLDELTNPLGTLRLEIENPPVFDLSIAPQDQKSRIEFQDLKPKEPPRTSELTIEIKTNLGKPYQVSQNVLSALTNKEGDKIDPKYFTLHTESIGTKGALKVLDKQQVKEGESVLFASDNKGSSDKFKIIYELTSPPDLKAGDYNTRITYSLTEI